MSDQRQQPAPMTEARLAEIRIRAQQIDADGLGEILYPGSDNALPPRQWGVKVDQLVSRDVPALLAFVEAALPILRAVAGGHLVSGRQPWIPETGTLLPALVAVEMEERIQQQARALLSGTGAEAADEGSDAS